MRRYCTERLGIDRGSGKNKDGKPDPILLDRYSATAPQPPRWPRCVYKKSMGRPRGKTQPRQPKYKTKPTRELSVSRYCSIVIIPHYGDQSSILASLPHPNPATPLQNPITSPVTVHMTLSPLLPHPPHLPACPLGWPWEPEGEEGGWWGGWWLGEGVGGNAFPQKT